MTYELLDKYLEYTAGTEPPAIFHRWSLLSILAASLSRNMYIQHGHFTIYPNMYLVLMGNAGSRKSSAISIAKSLLKLTGYNHFAPTKTTKEKYFMDLSAAHSSGDDILEENLFGASTCSEDTTQSYITAGEFNTFFGNNILDFVTDLGELWDYKGRFESKVKNSKSVFIDNPVINILGGNTATNFSAVFPLEIIGQGFLSRILLIYGERTRPKITWPEPPCPQLTADLVTMLAAITKFSVTVGQMKVSKEALSLLDISYKGWKDLPDVRFESYSNRRFTHLLKVCILLAAIRCASEISYDDVVAANTYLTYIEHFMPKALGEFGKARHADVAHKIIQLLENSTGVITSIQIWKEVHKDLDKQTDLATLLTNLTQADKIQIVKGGFTAKRHALKPGALNKLIDFKYLTEEERMQIGQNS